MVKLRLSDISSKNGAHDTVMGVNEHQPVI
jgi:hypothetical protein